MTDERPAFANFTISEKLGKPVLIDEELDLKLCTMVITIRNAWSIIEKGKVGQNIPDDQKYLLMWDAFRAQPTATAMKNFQALV